jgi:hypothetical protein
MSGNERFKDPSLVKRTKPKEGPRVLSLMVMNKEKHLGPD